MTSRTCVVGGRRDSVKLENINVVQTQPLQRNFQAGDNFVHAERPVASGLRCLGADHNAVALHVPQGGADHVLRSVDRRRVDQVDAEVQCLANDADRVIRRLAGAQAKLAETAATQPGDADFKAGAAERGVLHGGWPWNMVRGW